MLACHMQILACTVFMTMIEAFNVEARLHFNIQHSIFNIQYFAG
jgi:hypothetical protein